MGKAHEEVVQDCIQEAWKLGVTLFKNDMGRAMTANGRWITYGLCNPGGSDLIGWKPVVITPPMVGKRLAVFCGTEVKIGKDSLSKEQRTFRDNLINAGGLYLLARGSASGMAEVFGD